MKAKENNIPVGARVDGRFRGKDIAGQRFAHLTALYPLKERSEKRNVVWHCRCDCGNEADFSYNALMYSDLRSCGCAKQAHNQILHSHLNRVDGTSLDRLKSEKRPENNTSGVKGAYFIRGKYVAKIVFQKKQYYLGTYDSLEEAAYSRREAEEKLKKSVLPCYEKWKARAQHDMRWAQENPMRIVVEKDADGQLNLLFSPEME